MIRKRMTALLLAGVMAVCLAGCKSGDGITAGNAADKSASADAGSQNSKDRKEGSSSVWEQIPEDEMTGAQTVKESLKNEQELSADKENGTSSEGLTDVEESEEASADAEADEAVFHADSNIVIGGTCKEDLKNIVAEFITANGLNTDNFSVSFMDLTTGETCYYNELKQFDAASTYKFPLNLMYYDMQAEGSISGDTIVPGTNTPLSECHHQSLEFSNNELSEAMMDNLGSYDVVKRSMRKYFTLNDAEIDSSYYNHNYYCSRMMMDCSKYLYDHQNEYSEALGYLTAAQPGQYFKKYITDCSIAQKYGQRDGYEHNAGIVFAEKPFVLSIYTYRAGGADLIGRLAKVFYDYTE